MTTERILEVAGLRWRLDGPLPEADRLGNLGKFLTGGDEAEITVSIRRQSPTPEPRGELRWEDWFSRVYETADGIQSCRIGSALTDPVPYAALCWAKASPDVQTLYLDDSACVYHGDRLVSALAMDLGLHRYGRGILHASWIERNGQAVWFSGPSGVGKSTQAAFWQEQTGTQILNGDKAAFCFSGERVLAAGLPFAGSSEYCENRTMPLRAIVMLRQASENTIVRLPMKTAAKLLLGQMPVQRWCRADVQAIADQAVRLAETVPVYELACRLGPQTVGLLDEELSKEDAQWNL